MGSRRSRCGNRRRGSPGNGCTLIQQQRSGKNNIAQYPPQAEKVYLEGAKALENKNLRKAVGDFAKAHELDPDNLRYTAAAEIGKQHLVTELVQEAEKAKLLGHMDESHVKLAEPSS